MLNPPHTFSLGDGGFEEDLGGGDGDSTDTIFLPFFLAYTPLRGANEEEETAEASWMNGGIMEEKAVAKVMAASLKAGE